MARDAPRNRPEVGDPDDEASAAGQQPTFDAREVLG
jgi:hypothetical protein